MLNERETRIGCHRGMFPDVLASLNPDGTYSRSQFTDLIIGAQKHCGQKCPSNCGYRQVTESLEVNINK